QCKPVSNAAYGLDAAALSEGRKFPPRLRAAHDQQATVELGSQRHMDGLIVEQGSSAAGGAEKFLRRGVVNDAHRRAPIDNQRGRNRKEGYAFDKLFGSVDGIDYPDARHLAPLGIVNVFLRKPAIVWKSLQNNLPNPAISLQVCRGYGISPAFFPDIV